MHLPQWRKNQIAVTISGSLMNFGYTLVMSFLPIYVRELGCSIDGRNRFMERSDSQRKPADGILDGSVVGTAGRPARYEVDRNTGHGRKCGAMVLDGIRSQRSATIYAEDHSRNPRRFHKMLLWLW